MADSPLIFADYASSRTITNLKEIREFEDVANLDPDKRARLYEGVPLHDGLRPLTAQLNSLTGLNILGFHMGIWSWQPGSHPQNFMLMRGSVDVQRIVGRLLDLDYKQDEYEGNEYYWLYDNFKVDLRHPLRQRGLPINRMSFVGDWLLAASATDTLKKLIEVQNEEALNLLDSKRHQALAEAVGEGLLGGAFLTPQWIVDDWNKLNRRPLPRLDQYLEGSDGWGILSSYTLVLFGYRVQGTVEETMFALYYPDPAGAERDAAELERRWNSFYYEPFVGRETETPVAHSCAPLATTAITDSNSSILVGTCPVIRSAERDPAVAGPNLWLSLFGSKELQFLVPDLAVLKGR